MFFLTKLQFETSVYECVEDKKVRVEHDRFNSHCKHVGSFEMSLFLEALFMAIPHMNKTSVKTNDSF